MELNVISFNIRCVDDANGYSIAERSPRLKKVIEPYNADVIGLQEYTPLWEETIDQMFSSEYDFFNKYRASTGWIESCPILWKKEKFECIKSGYFWLSDTPEVESGGWDELGLNRICIYAILKEKQSEKEFVFMNTHFGFGNDCHKKSVKLICNYAKEISDLPFTLYVTRPVSKFSSFIILPPYFVAGVKVTVPLATFAVPTVLVPP